MKYQDVEVGQKVYDRWWPQIHGFVVSKTHKLVKVQFDTALGLSDLCWPEVGFYDRQHLKYLVES